MKLTALLPWFGGKRTLASEIVRQLGPHKYYLETCAGSMAVLFAKEPSSHETVCDLHGGMTNLSWVIQKEDLAIDLFGRLQRALYSEELYAASKAWLDQWINDLLPHPLPSIDWAYHYFLASWMGRNGVSGTERVNYQLATRWTSGGGSGPLRWKNAVDSIPAWCERLRNVLILRRSLFDVLPRMEDEEGLAIYADPPYLPDTMGKSRYLHDFTPEHHKQLAKELGRFKKARVVVSYYAHPSLELLYPGWTFHDCSRQKNLHVQNRRGGDGAKTAPEVLILNGPVFTSEKHTDLLGSIT